ncbi:MAG: VOC family protein [Actinomycetota bacterium]
MLDHLVLATPDLAETVAEVAAATGVTPSVGGPHVGRGTRNELCSFGDGTYLEIIGPDPDQPPPAEPPPFGIDRVTRRGLVTWCAKGSDLAALVESAGTAGLAMVGPEAMQRQAPEGLLSWDLALPAFDTEGGIVPFFIDWADSVHPSTTSAPGLTLAGLTGHHPDPTAVRATLDVLGVSIAVEQGSSAGLSAKLRGPAGEIDVGPARYE